MENAACHFVFYTGPRKGEAQGFNTARVSIGRASNCDFRLEAFQIDQVATHHAEVLLEDGHVWCLYDLGTKSGTYVNGERVHERCTLMHEDYVRFGKEGPEVIFRIGEPQPGSRQPLPQIFPVTAELEFFSGSDSGRIFPVNASGISNIGRRADLEVPLDPRGDMIVSGNHCNIHYVDGHFVLSDTSRNGTYINNDLIELQPIEIIDGDVIMLGDGGPQARFHIDSAKRHYPNHRPLSPVIKTDTPAKNPAKSVFTPMASAKPYSSGPPPEPDAASPVTSGSDASDSEIKTPTDTPVLDTPTDTLETMEAPPSDLPANSLLGSTENDLDDLDNVTTDAEPPTEAATAVDPETAETTVASTTTPKRSLSSMIPFPAKIDFKPGRKLIFGAIGLVALIGIIMMMFSNGDSEPDSIVTGKMQTVSNSAAGLKVEVPEGWEVLNSGEYISIESPDKKINVDYTRDPSLNKEKVLKLLSQGGGQVSKNVDKQTVGGKTAEVYQGSANSLRRLATLRKGEGAPVLAFLEITEKDLKSIDMDRLGKLLIANVDTIGDGPEQVATPVPKETSIPKAPATATPQASPQIDSAALPTPVAKTDSAPPATATPEPPTATQAAATDTPGSGPTIKSKSLNLTLTAPEKSWTGSSEEADAMLTLADNNGLEVRIARDSSQLDANATFKAMEEEKWKKDGDKITPEFQAGEFARDDQNLILVLIPEKAKTTIVIYATSSKDFDSPQRHGITNIINQIIAAQK